MPAHARMRAAAVGRQATLPIYRWTCFAAVAALASLIEACTPIPPVPLAGPDPRPLPPSPIVRPSDPM